MVISISNEKPTRGMTLEAMENKAGSCGSSQNPGTSRPSDARLHLG